MDLVELFNRAAGNEGIQGLSQPVQIALLLSVFTLLPAALMTTTCYTRVIIVLSFVRQGLATQQVPPNLVLTGLALFISLFIMKPTFDEVNEQAINPYLQKQINGNEAIRRGLMAQQKFMLRQTRKQDLALFLSMSGETSIQEPEQTPFVVLVPAFIISELKTAFIMGFCIYLPFLMVDLVVSSVLTSMGMVMMPPALISAPFKILLFVLADGWHLVARAITASFL
ncbi:flagellar type III secretion system pore protein FliP [Zavarzinella formosa]|uniref:flagellar type III secretion system pore protein FliP n=1 Tax=Zavarzinella formosa TaxID=360055 RepID=UPI0002D8F4B5|nr:flagellar type III secretion system pore protein FliP [Zavarzinella formosa]